MLTLFNIIYEHNLCFQWHNVVNLKNKRFTSFLFLQCCVDYSAFNDYFDTVFILVGKSGHFTSLNNIRDYKLIVYKIGKEWDNTKNCISQCPNT